MSYQPMTKHQQIAMERLGAWWRGGGREYRLGGYAGSGKTALIAHLPEILGINEDDVIYVCPTNAAKEVLRKKLDANGSSCGVATIHSLLRKYEGITHCVSCPGPDECHKPAGSRRRCACGKPEFSRKLVLVQGLVIVDEASMVTKEMMGWLRETQARLLFSGDPAQLLPVGETFSAIRGKLDYEMTKPVRQLAGSPILDFATAARERRFDQDIPNGGRGKVARLTEYDRWLLELNWRGDGPEELANQVVIVGRNETADLLNRRARKHLGFKGAHPVPGDLLVCRTNIHAAGVFNSTRAIVTDISPRLRIMDVRLLGTDRTWRGYYDPRPLEPDAAPPNIERLPRWEFGYAMTCHVAQGSEWDCVTVVRDGLYDGEPESWNWLYTAITRAKSELVVIG